MYYVNRETRTGKKKTSILSLTSQRINILKTSKKGTKSTGISDAPDNVSIASSIP